MEPVEHLSLTQPAENAVCCLHQPQLNIFVNEHRTSYSKHVDCVM